MRKMMLVLVAMVLSLTFSGCGAATAHVHGKVDLANDTVFTALSTLQDTEMFAYKQGLIPVGDYKPKTETTPEVCSGHRCFNAKLVIALQAGKTFNQVLMAWVPGTPMPKDIVTIAKAVADITTQVLAMLPDSATKANLLLYTGYVQNAMLVLITEKSAQ